MNEIEYLQKALLCSNQSGKSPLVHEYEMALAAFFKSPNAIAVNSGSAAIQTALQAIGACPGKKVIVSAAAPLPTLLPIMATGVQIIFADCNPYNPSINSQALLDAIDDDVIAVVEVSLWGYLQDYTELTDIVKKRGIYFIEDAAHAHGSVLGNYYAGTLSDIGCFSTHQKKILSTGEGGFILTKENELADKIRKFAKLGNLDGKTFGMNFKISAFTAAIGLARLLEFPKVLEMRKNGRSTLLSYLKEYAFKEIAHIGEPNGYNLVIDMGENVKAELQMALTNAGIELDTTKYGYKCGYKHQLFLQPNLTCPNAESLIQRLIQLPTDSDCEIIADKFIKAITSTV